MVLMRSLEQPGSPGGTAPVRLDVARLRKSTGRHPDTLKTIWGRGIDRIARELNGGFLQVARSWRRAWVRRQ